MKRIAKFTLVGTGVSGLGLATYRSGVTQDGTFDPNNVAVVRFGRAALTVAKVGYDYKRTLFGKRAETLFVEDPKSYVQLRSEVHLRSAEKLLRLCEINGGCFIKVGQHIAALDYLLPSEYVETMKPLRSKAPEMPIEDVKRVIQEDLLVDPSDIFTHFDEKPLGVASLAQVHKAVLKDTGEVVAVKVQHRYVKNHSFVDIYTMDFLVRMIHAAFPQFEFMWLADEMRKNLPLELNFTQEGKNAEKVAEMLSHFSWLKIPRIYWPLTTGRILTMEYCPGCFVDDVEYMKQHKIDLAGVSKKISQMYAEMIYKYGYVHCDPHAGNILVNKSNNGTDEIILLDHGLYTQLTTHFRVNFSKFMYSIDNADVKGMQESAETLNAGKYYGLMACMITGRSWESIVRGIYRTPRSSGESSEVKENAARYLREIVEVLASVNREMILIFKTVDLLRNISSTLGTQKNMSHQYQMGRWILKCLNDNERHLCNGNLICIAKAYIKGILGQIYLWLWWSRPASWSRSLLGIGYA